MLTETSDPGVPPRPSLNSLQDFIAIDLEMVPDNVIPQSSPLDHRGQPVEHGIANRKTLSLDIIFFTGI